MFPLLRAGETFVAAKKMFLKKDQKYVLLLERKKCFHMHAQQMFPVGANGETMKTIFLPQSSLSNVSWFAGA